MSLDRHTKTIQIDTFEPASDIKWIRCLNCERAVNVFGDAKADPLVFGQMTSSPESQSHSCVISCRCGATKIKAWGKMKSLVLPPRSCIAVEVSTERVFDKPCFCREQKGSEPGHIHASQPAQQGPA